MLTEYMSVNPCSDPNTEIEYRNPVPSGLKDIQGLLLCLQTIQTMNPISISKLDTPMTLKQVYNLCKEWGEIAFLLKTP